MIFSRFTNNMRQTDSIVLLKFSQTYYDASGINDFNLEVNNSLIGFIDFNRPVSTMLLGSYSF